MSDEGHITVEIVHSARKTVAITVKNGRVAARAPYGVSDARVMDFVRKNMDWIMTQFAKIKEAEIKKEPAFTMDELRDFADRLEEILPARLEYWSKKIGVTYNRVTIRNQKTRWGSCSSKGNLNFNCVLALAPEFVQDYIFVHELCHRKEMNHSPRFYGLVKSVLPDYERAEKWLKTEGGKIIERLR